MLRLKLRRPFVIVASEPRTAQAALELTPGELALVRAYRRCAPQDQRRIRGLAAQCRIVICRQPVPLTQDSDQYR